VRAAVIVVLGALGAAPLFAVSTLTGGRHVSIVVPKTHGYATAKGDPGAAAMTVTGEGREHNEISARDKWFFHQRAYPSKTTPAGALERAMKQTIALRRSAPQPAAVNPTWVRVGPNPIAKIGPDALAASGQFGGAPPLSGRVSAIAPAASNANIVYLGGANGGVWKSINAGGSWAPVWPNNQPSFSIGAIAVNPTNASDVWVGTGEANGSGDTYYGNGIFHSTNGGSSWVKVGGTTFNGCFVSDLAIVSSTTVNAAVLEFPGVTNPACATSKRGVWRTTTTGTSWSKISLPGTVYNAPSDFTQATGAPSTIYLATYIDGVWRSTNGGASWTKLSISLPAYYRSAVSAYNSSTFYLVLNASDRAGFGGLYRIGNALASPAKTTISPGASTNTACTYPSQGGGQCFYDLTVAADPTNINRSFVGGIRVFRYTYAGAPTAGTPIGYGGTAGKIHVDQHATIFDSAHNMWEGSDGGAYRLPATQLGATTPAFLNRNGTGGTALGITEFNGWTSGSYGGGTFLGGTQDNGTVKYNSVPAPNCGTAGLNWCMDHGGDGGASAFLNANTYWASYSGPAVFKTTDGGTSYSQVFSSGDPAEFYPPMEQNRANANMLYRGTDRIWRSPTGGGFFAISPHFSGAVSAIGVEKATSPAYLYAGVDNGSSTPSRIYYTHNGSLASPTWFIGTGIPDRYITDIWVNPANHSNAILTLSGFGTSHLYRTTNGGASWTTMNGNLPNVPVNSVAVDPANVNKVFLGTDTGVFWTTNGTAASPTWVNSSVGLPNTTVMDIRVDGDSLVAATHGRSVWRAAKP
jgi:hypothetical protein